MPNFQLGDLLTPHDPPLSDFTITFAMSWNAAAPAPPPPPPNSPTGTYDGTAGSIPEGWMALPTGTVPDEQVAYISTAIRIAPAGWQAWGVPVLQP